MRFLLPGLAPTPTPSHQSASRHLPTPPRQLSIPRSCSCSTTEVRELRRTPPPWASHSVTSGSVILPFCRNFHKSHYSPRPPAHLRPQPTKQIVAARPLTWGDVRYRKKEAGTVRVPHLGCSQCLQRLAPKRKKRQREEISAP